MENHVHKASDVYTRDRPLGLLHDYTSSANVTQQFHNLLEWW